MKFKTGDTNMRAAIYARISTDKQSESSIDEQVRRCQHYIQSQGTVENPWLHTKVYSDTGTGMTTTRQGFKELMDDIADWDVVIAYKLDRFHRSSRNAQDWAISLNGIGKNFVAIDISIDTTTAMGMGIFRIITALNEMEVALTKERTRMGLTAVRNESRWVGKPPYGYDSVWKMTEEDSDKGLLVLNLEESDVVKSIFNMRNQRNEDGKRMTLSAIAEELITAGVLTKTGKRRWSSATINSILNNKLFYQGLHYTTDNELKEYSWDPILENDPEEE